MSLYEHPDDVLWEPTNNDLPPTEPQPGDFDVLSHAEEAAEWVELHEALMGGRCGNDPTAPPDAHIVGRYIPATPSPTPPHPEPEER